MREVKRSALTEEEIKQIAEQKFSSDRVSRVRDIFLFSCYTALAYADVKKLTRSEIQTGFDGTPDFADSARGDSLRYFSADSRFLIFVEEERQPYRMYPLLRFY